MRVSTLAIVLSSGLALTGCAATQQLILSSASQESEAVPTPTTSPTESLTSARKLAWEAAVIVQHPPHSAETWQEARVKWRQAIQLLETIPSGSKFAAQAQEKLPTYRTNYAAIDARLTTEQAAASQLEQAQTLAWQAAVTTQNPPHPLRVWQRAKDKWQEAISLLEAIPPKTSAYDQGQQKLTTYRENYATVSKHIALETSAQSSLKQFSTTAARLQELSTVSLTSWTIERIGINYEDYLKLVQELQTAFNQFARLPGARKHPAYTDLQTITEDYRFALKLWRDYLNFKQSNSQWLYGDSYNQLFPISETDRSTLEQKYGAKTFSGGAKASLRLSVWAIWQQASSHFKQLQKKLPN